jgi:hypothetical protein
MIGLLAQMLNSENIKARTGAKQVLFDITAQSASSESERISAAGALRKSLAQSAGKAANDYLDWLLKMAECSN